MTVMPQLQTGGETHTHDCVNRSIVVDVQIIAIVGITLPPSGPCDSPSAGSEH